MNQFRIGHGFDAHRFAAGKPLVLCGVNIPYPLGLLAYSDGDVAIHALCDAMLGALALGDIGLIFPDSDKVNKNRDSREFLIAVNTLIKDNGYKLSNTDLTIIAEKPELKPYILAMRQKLSAVLAVDGAQISIKATTTEKMGYIGREEGISCHCVALLNSR